MNYNISKPSLFLSQYVKYYWSLDKCLPINAEHTQRIVPSGLFELIFYFKSKPESSDKNKPIADGLLISGQQKGYYDITIKDDLSLFAIYFYPHGLSMFLNLPLNELFNQSVPLKYILKDLVTELEEELYGTEILENRIAIIEQFLTRQFKKSEKRYQYNRIKHTVDIINNKKGVVDVEFLVSESCYSRKQFERTFSEIIGISPKQFLKVVRFQNAIYQKSKVAQLSLTELAHTCGYYDQAHMINDFKSLSGFTPKQFFTDCEPFSDYFG